MRNAPPPFQPEEPSEWADERPSKSELKRQMHDLQQLGESLSELSEARVAKLDLPESLLDALAEFRRIRSFEGRRRQLQFIGKLMRQVDPDPIRESVAAAKLGSAKETLALHEAERWREELLASDDAITRWINAHPDTEPQPLRSLVRAARKDLLAVAPEARRGRPYRDLFQLIKNGLAVSTGAPSAEEPHEPHE
jgi:ribosome-associated protein